jgi:hypothetical protein
MDLDPVTCWHADHLVAASLEPLPEAASCSALVIMAPRLERR